MFASAKVFYLNILILFGLILSVISDCQINLPTFPALIPSFYKYVGTQKLKIKTNKFSENVLKLHELQELEAYCDINFKQPPAYKTSNKIYIKCEGNYIYISTDIYHKKNSNYFSSPTLECSLLKWHLYESSSKFAWCPSNVTSYILARPKSWDLTPSLYNYLAGICYDIYNNSFYSIYYTLAPRKIENKQPIALRDLYEPLIKIDYIRETFGENSLPINDFEDFQTLDWIRNFKYDFRSIIRHRELFHTYSDQFVSLLQFVWWSNLSLYNWKRYIDALDAHVEKDNQTYDILAGVSGAIKVPIMQSCQKNYTMEEVVFDTNRKIPLYVWNYLQDRGNSTNEVVIIGFNSPFNEFYSQDDIKFCTDRCQEISWLKEASNTFRYKIMGFIICCSVKEVRSSQILYGFPEIDIYSKPVETTELPNVFDEEQTEINYSENDI